ncbi:MAG: hypothetical protein ABI333_28420 [bacterium]
MTPRPLLLTAAAVAVLLGGGCPNEKSGPGARTARPADPSRRARRASLDAAPLRQQIETICDRMEDCAVERNVDLARTYGGTPADITLAREQARTVLHTGFVRRWCQQRLHALTLRDIVRIHRCLRRTACDPFFKCAKLASTTGSPVPGSRAVCARR